MKKVADVASTILRECAVMRLVLCASVLLTLAPPRLTAQVEARAHDDVLYIARHLDVVSFPNSIGPVRRPGARTFVDYGFTTFEEAPEGVKVTEDDRQWYFTVKLMADRDEVKELCVSDVAMNGGTYKARLRVNVKLGPDGLFHAVATPPEGNSC